MTLIRGSRPRIKVLLAALVLTAGVGGTALVAPSPSTVAERPSQDQQPAQDQQPSAAPKQSPAARAPKAASYPIGGYFVFASPSSSRNTQKLSEIKTAGADTVITFGTALAPATLATLPKECVIDGVNCAKAAAGTLEVNRYFTYSDGSVWSSQAVKCPQDRRITSQGKAFLVLVLPAQGTGCTSTNGKYDVVVAGGGAAGGMDPAASLALAATKLGMKFYAGLPLPVKRTDTAYLPDVSYQGTLTLFTERFLQYQAATNNVKGLAGFYHSTEMPVTDGHTFDPILDLYRMQNQAIHRILPARGAIVSPYLDARVSAFSISLTEARKGIRRIAQTASGLVLNIAIQDGMGTGKGGAFQSNEANSAVDRYAESIVGKGSWSSKYVAPIRDYFLAAAAGISGTGAVLWANLEGMAPATASNPCGDSLRGQSSKARIDRQLQQLSNAQKIISFMWDSYYTCVGTGVPLKAQVESGIATPIITDATFDAATGQVRITGFNLSGGNAQVKWTTKGGQRLVKTVKPTSTNTAYGVQSGMNPELEMILVNVGKTTLAAGRYYTVNVTNQWGAENDAFYSQSIYTAQSSRGSKG
ncbi:DUF4434 domain-containing protein [Arthrobacter sp. StoSoilB13]|uniref:DUF4434 domain-containing protein n=1 Tax=Arthrobacter sp. StoSoilB13 TaxID=2830993 RepID=UPI001CC3C7C2|nr:DUF4434 domain-containing protein [Arthrobacter sp. StoSoilB13]BCW49568.1 hypothetical protein StoSoilB13_19100 [Arthrobacter sp. StoSoilB13]